MNLRSPKTINLVNTKTKAEADKITEDAYVKLRDDMTNLLAELQNRVVYTPDGGVAVYMTNKTGAATVKGAIVAANTDADNSGFIVESAEFNAMGVVYEAGIANGGQCLVVIAGSAYVLWKDTVASMSGNIAIAADTDGRAIDIAVPDEAGIAAATPNLFRKIGHVLETKDAGTNVLVKCVIHFN